MPDARARGEPLRKCRTCIELDAPLGNLHRAYAELRGEPLGADLPLQQVIGDMVAYNDGQPLHCLA